MGIHRDRDLATLYLEVADLDLATSNADTSLPVVKTTVSALEVTKSRL